jgi:hypothetical protein
MPLDDLDEGLAAFRGLLIGLALVTPFWLAVGAALIWVANR